MIPEYPDPVDACENSQLEDYLSKKKEEPSQAPPFFFLSVCTVFEQFVEISDLLFLLMVAERQQADGDTG